MKHLGWFLIFATGCYSFSSLQRARTIGRHHVEIFGAPELLAVPGGKAIAGRPVAELGVRYGLTGGVDLEGRVTTLGFTAAAHLQLHRGTVDVLVAPGIALTSPDKLAFELPVPVGFRLARDKDLIFTTRLVYQLRFGVPGFARPIGFLFGGEAVGFAWRFGRHFTILPEVAALGQLAAEPGFSSNLGHTIGLQLSLGALVDF
jgi:hypothetical protein